MKKHITVEDLKQLTEAQKQHLFELWQPSQMQACCLTENDNEVMIYCQTCDAYILPCNVTNEGTHDNCGTVVEYEDGNIIYIAGDDLDVYKTEEYKQLGILPLLSIGDMIELLNPENNTYIQIESKPRTKEYEVWQKMLLFEKKELCDALWEAVKEVLAAD